MKTYTDGYIAGLRRALQISLLEKDSRSTFAVSTICEQLEKESKIYSVQDCDKEQPNNELTDLVNNMFSDLHEIALREDEKVKRVEVTSYESDEGPPCDDCPFECRGQCGASDWRKFDGEEANWCPLRDGGSVLVVAKGV